VRRTSAVLAAALLAAAGLATANGAASAASGPRAGEDRGRAHQRVVDYWTPGRMAAAVPRGMQRSQAAPDTPGKGGKGGGSTDTVTGATWTRTGAPVEKTTGRVFFIMGGVKYVCSGSAVAGGRRGVNLVLTAGHCLWDDVDGWASFLMFIPGYHEGAEPYGRWTAESVYTTRAWTKDGHAWTDDTGVAVVNGDEPFLADTLGVTLPAVRTDLDRTALEGQTFSAFGYPSAQKYNGQTLTYCQGPPAHSFDGVDSLSIECDMTGGSSGGPWYDEKDGVGEIVSVNSYGYYRVKRMFGPVLDGAESTLLAEAADGRCGRGEVCAAGLAEQP
jgi:hypothetical protein